MTSPRSLLLLIAGFLIVSLAAIAWGGSSVFGLSALNVLVGGGTPEEHLVVMYFRLPRIVIAALAGGGLAVAGVVLQTVLRNELVEPTSIGISSGAGLGVTFLVLIFPLAPAKAPLLLPLSALAGAILVLGLVLVVAGERGSTSPVRLLLVGITISIGLAAAQLLIGMRMSREVYNFVYTWLIGTLNGLEWKHAVVLSPWIVVLIPALMVQGRNLDVLALGKNEAAGLGVNVARTRVLLAVAATALGGACVAVVGSIGFIGLVAPHLARYVSGVRHANIIPTAAVIGAALLMFADTLSRRLPTASEIPAGILVAVIGAPYFLVLLLRARI